MVEIVIVRDKGIEGRVGAVAFTDFKKNEYLYLYKYFGIN